MAIRSATTKLELSSPVQHLDLAQYPPVMAPTILWNADWDFKDFKPLSATVANAFAIAGQIDETRRSNFEEMMDHCNANRGELRYSSGSRNNLPHMVIAKAPQSYNCVAQNVPYTQDGNVSKDLVFKVLDFAFVNVGNYQSDPDKARIPLVLSDPRAALKCNTVYVGNPRRWRGILRIGRITATVPVRRIGECHARGLPSSDLRRKMPDIRDGERRAFERGHRRAAGPPSGHHIAGAPARRRRAGIPLGTGAEEGVGAPERGLFGPGEADGGAPGEGRGEAGEGWSPERVPGRVPGRLRLEDPGTVGRQRIYDLVRADRRDGGTLCGHLRRRGKKRNRQGGRHAGRGHIPGRRDIPERPEIVRKKAGTGDREADTVIGGGHGGAVVPPVDGCPQFTPVQRVDGKRAEAAGGAMTDLPEGPGARVHTITAYDGREFAGHAKMAKALEANFLLPTPHHSWERRLNGHINGPPPRYLPKGTDLRQVTDARVKRVQDILNARPRKALGYLTSAEAFARARPP